jgi:hypothetical protein
VTKSFPSGDFSPPRAKPCIKINPSNKTPSSILFGFGTPLRAKTVKRPSTATKRRPPTSRAQRRPATATLPTGGRGRGHGRRSIKKNVSHPTGVEASSWAWATMDPMKSTNKGVESVYKSPDHRQRKTVDALTLLRYSSKHVLSHAQRKILDQKLKNNFGTTIKECVGHGLSGGLSGDKDTHAKTKRRRPHAYRCSSKTTTSHWQQSVLLSPPKILVDSLHGRRKIKI